jgi:ABC-2 type transport system permease protein
VAGAVTNLVVHAAQVPSTIWGVLPATVLWFVLGYVGYSFVFAAAGSLVGRQEEVQVASLPLTLPLIAAVLLAYAAAAAADTAWYSALSILPPFAPILIPVRIAFGVVPAWQFALALVLMVASIAVVISVTARIYSAALVRGGARIGWRAALGRS